MGEIVDLGDFEQNVDEEKVEEVVEKVCEEATFDEIIEDYHDNATSELDIEKYQIPTKEVINNDLKSIIPPDVFKPFGGFFGEERNYSDLHFNE
ncbi:hypothetical protein Hanom_Chr11g01014361 [Helianthus anomalus]